MKKTLKIAVFCLAFSALIAPAVTFALAVDTNYVALTDIPGIQGATARNPGGILQTLFNLAIGLGGILAVVMLIIAGFKYMYEESIFGKGKARQQITNAFFGLALILGSYIILKTINGDLLRISLFLPQGDGKLGGLVAEQAALDTAMQNAQIALKTAQDLRNKISDIDTQIKNLEQKIGTSTAGFVAERQQIDTLTSQRGALAAKEVYTRTVADVPLAIARAQEEYFGTRAKSGSTAVTNVNNTLSSAQRQVDSAIQQVRASDPAGVNPDTKKQLSALQAQKITIDTSVSQFNVIEKYNDYQTYLNDVAQADGASVTPVERPPYTSASSLADAVYKMGKDAASQIVDTGDKAAGLALLDASKKRAQQVCPSCTY